MRLNKFLTIFIGITTVFVASCGSNTTQIIQDIDDTIVDNIQPNIGLKILSLGDSYTIGTSVCDACKFPSQLVDSLSQNTPDHISFTLEVIARNGWTTSNLIAAVKTVNLQNNFDLVTLLIGVNNQFQGRPFSIYEEEFPELINIAISSVGGDANKLIVLSIPDYAYTPFGNGEPEISAGIKKYNDFTRSYCEANNISYINITDITEQGLNNPLLVASDGLHPSELAYSKFAQKLLPIALNKLNIK